MGRSHNKKKNFCGRNSVVEYLVANEVVVGSSPIARSVLFLLSGYDVVVACDSSKVAVWVRFPLSALRQWCNCNIADRLKWPPLSAFWGSEFIGHDKREWR